MKLNWFIFLLSILVGLFFILLFLPLFISIEIVEKYSTIFYNFGVGLGALFGGLSGINYINAQIKESNIQNKIKHFKNKYPDNEHDKSWDLIREENDNKLYIRELGQNNVIHHIYNPNTRDLLGLGSFGFKDIPKDKFSRFKVGDTYRI